MDHVSFSHLELSVLVCLVERTFDSFRNTALLAQVGDAHFHPPAAFKRHLDDAVLLCTEAEHCISRERKPVSTVAVKW